MIVSSGLVPVVVMAGEIGSVIAATLASVTYQRTLAAHKNSHAELEESESIHTREKSDTDKSKARCNEHIEVLLKVSSLRHNVTCMYQLDISSTVVLMH